MFYLNGIGPFSPSLPLFPGTRLCVVLHSPQTTTKNHIPATIQYITLSLSKANTPPASGKVTLLTTSPCLEAGETNPVTFSIPCPGKTNSDRTGNRLTSNFRTLYSLENLRQTFLSKRQRSLNLLKSASGSTLHGEAEKLHHRSQSRDCAYRTNISGVHAFSFPFKKQVYSPPIISGLPKGCPVSPWSNV